MLSPSDAQVVARDPELVGLPVLLDPPLFLELLGARLPHIHLKQIACTYVRYKPQTNCVASYQLTTSLGQINLYAKAYTARDTDKLIKSKRGPSSSVLGPGELHLVDSGIGVFIFPNDASLESLRVLEDDSTGRSLLGK
ncbi:MAG TPA: hypothetical protein VGP99_05955, partial [Tepidisphaeraceae bacterium]|nr:hypothetical protein [Tepidisphaeraceae bacterium]